MPSYKSEDQTIKDNSTTSVKRELIKSAQTTEYRPMLEEDQSMKLYNDPKIQGDHDLKKCSKKKPKKNKKAVPDNQNISVKSGFNKFDALQKRSLIHNPEEEAQKNCHLCNKPVYKMEEVKAEKNIYHGNCFRCNECNKQLKVDTYQSHEGVLYCNVHFKQLFIPKSVEDNEIVQPRKPELIIRENQPAELPPDVVRASDKPDLGLEELHQLNVRSRFQVFEYKKINNNDDQQYDIQRNSNNDVRLSATIFPKVAKLQQLVSSANGQPDLNCIPDNGDDFEEEIDFDFTSDNPNADLERQKKHDHKRELPVGIGEAMHDIRNRFEKGHGVQKEERREERKLEIQNIRSRLFMGKQARIKEMYQQAVADSENATEKKHNIDINVDSKSLRERFENGEIFRESQFAIENNDENSRKPTIEKEADVFESAISKKSRSIFMELDANFVTGKNQNILTTCVHNKPLQHHTIPEGINNQLKSEIDNNVVKCGETVEDIKIETTEISKKFKFFEKYQSTEHKKSVFRITPPREGLVNMPSPEDNLNKDGNFKECSPDRYMVEHSRTTSIMLNKFRELEKNPKCNESARTNSLKCFTPPPDGNRRLYTEQDSDEYESTADDEDDEYEDGSNIEEDGDGIDNYSHLPQDDEALKEAQNAARTKQLRIKFEKWQANEIKHEKSDDANRYRDQIADENSIESTQSIKERFEKMRNAEKLPKPAQPRYQVNRFV